jgi:hypothetical protein
MTSRLSGAALVIAIYDWALLFGDGASHLSDNNFALIIVAHHVESMTIWKTRWTLPKGIYYFVGGHWHL